MKNNMKKLLSVFLAVVMVAGIVPFGGFVAPIEASASSATYSKEYYYTNGTSFLSTDMALALPNTSWIGSVQSGSAEKKLSNNGYNVCSQDLNDGAGGEYLYFGWKTTTDPANAIRALGVYNGSNPPASYNANVNGGTYTFYPVNKYFPKKSDTLTTGTCDLNIGAGGDYVYLYYCTDPNYGPPLTDFDWEGDSSTNDSGNICQTSVNWINTTETPANLNSGSGGKDVHFFTHSRVDTQVNTSSLHSAITTADNLLANSSNYVSVSNLQSAVNTGKTIVNDYNADGLSCNYDQTAINNATNAINSAINALQTTVTLNGNGGNVSASSFNVTVGSATTVNYNVSSYTASRTGYTFKGWATSASATSGSTSTVSAGLKPTLYAVWEANKYTVIFDSLLDVSKWNTSSASNGVISDVGNGGFIITSNDGVSAANSTSPLFPVTAGKNYVVDIDIEGTNWDVYIFFYDDSTTSGLGIDFADGPDRRFSSSGIGNFDENGNGVFTAPAGATRAVIRVDANGANNAVTYRNIKVYEQGTVEDGVSYTPSQTVTYDSAYGTLPTPTKDKYDFLGWFKADGTQITSSTTVKQTDTLYVYSKWERSGYTVVWKNHDGTVLETDEGVAAGSTPVYNGAVPTKQGDAQYSYTFAGWTPTVSAADSDITYTATFTQVLNKYTVTWKNHDGTVLETDNNVAYGTEPVYNGSTPSKTGDAQFSYTFTGWSPAVSSVTGDVTYTAQFSESTNKYTVTWKNYDDTVLETDSNVPYGTEPTYDGAEPVKPADAQYTYTFAGWEPAVTDVTGNVSYKAKFTETLRTYTVTWKNEDGTVLETDSNVPYGTTPTYDGADPVKAGNAQYSYTFAGWTPAVGEVKGDATYTAKFTQSVNKYTVTWKNSNGYVLETDDNVLYGSEPSYDGETPVKAGDAQYTYTFAGWSPELSDVTGNVTYTATFTQTVNEYTVEFVNHDGTVLQTGKVPYGTTPVYTGSEPVKTGDAQYSYAFIGWDADPVPVKGDATYTAQFEESTNVYVVTWKNYDGTVLDTNNVPYGQTPEYKGETPVKAATVQYTYTFAGWEPEVDEVTGDAVYTAKFTETVNKYTIKFVDEDGTVLQTGKLDYGSIPSYAGETPVKEATAQYTYTFDKWTPAIKAVDGDATYTATYSSVVNKYTVTWVNFDDTVLETDKNVEYGATPSYDGAEPTKAADAQYTYAFSGWTPDVDTVKGNVTYKATFTETLRTYTVVWEDENGDAIETDYNVPYGTVPTFDGETPVKAATAQYTYTFDKWSPEVVAVKGDATYTAVFKTTPREYTVSWVADGVTVHSQKVAYGADVPTGVAAVPAKTGHTGEWDYTGVTTMPAEDITIEAVYTPVNYTISWEVEGTVVDTDSVAYGTLPSYTGSTPVKTEDSKYTYEFAGWTPEISVVSGEATYVALFNSVPQTYTIYWYAEDNSLVTTHQVAYGSAITNIPKVPEKLGSVGSWADVPETMPDHDVMIYPVYVKGSLVTWFLEGTADGASYQQGFENGTQIAYNRSNPTKLADAEYTYTFEGWATDENGNLVIGADNVGYPVASENDFCYYAVFSKTPREYTIEWVADGEVVYSEIIAYGSAVDFIPEVPAKTGHTGKWGTSPATMPAEDVTITAEYTPINYTITWVVGDNSHDTTFAYGTTPSFTGSTAKPSTATTDYTFIGWDKEIETVTGGTTYTAQYSESARKYTVTWQYDNGTVIDTFTVANGEAITDVPVIADKEGHTYSYTVPEAMPAEDIVIVVTYEAKDYTITWVTPSGSTETTWKYGTTPVYAGETPVKEATAEKVYTFAGWNPEILVVTGNATYTAQFTESARRYSVVWYVNGEFFDARDIAFGDIIPTLDVPQVPGYNGVWDNPFRTMPAHDVTINAVYNAKKYTVYWKVDGLTVYSASVAYGDSIPSKAVPEKVGCTGEWVNVPDKMPAENITISAVYTANDYTITWRVDGVEHSDTITYGNEYVLTLDGAAIPEEVRVTIGGSLMNAESYHYDAGIGTLTIYGHAITGNIYVTARAAGGNYNIILNVTNATLSNSSLVIAEKTAYHTQIIPAAGYLLPSSVDVFVDGIPVDGFTYNPANGKLTINAEVIVGELEIAFDCPPDPDYDPSATPDDAPDSGHCNCSCHSESAFTKFFFDLITLLRKLFGMDEYRYCECGASHW